jgi:NAD(P)-dependent dehydrogenase (short-subunit alcohol dehydrogenase family)
MEYNLKDKVVLITGAAGSIGKGIAVEFAKEKAKVFITDLKDEGLKLVKDEINAFGGICEFKSCNITNEQEVKSVFDKSVSIFGKRIDVLVNVAGIVGQGKVEEITEADWDKIFAVNCKGSFFFIKYAVPFMKENKFGKIVNFSSKSGKTGSALMSHYSAAKGAIIGFTQALAFELADFGINVNCVCPGIVENSGVWSNVSAGYVQNLKMPMDKVVDKFSEKVPLKRLAKIQEIVAVTLFLSSPGANYMTGQAINISGGREMH